MMEVNLITEAIATAGLREISNACGVTYQAVRKWEARNKLPRTEYSGETNYAQKIIDACTAVSPNYQRKRDDLLSGASDQSTA